jgi:threonyl-tRNA synthetase
VPAPDVAVAYWGLPQGATMRDVVLAIRADEACHAHVNHTYGAMRQDAASPFRHDSHVVP